jgi:hypothetical protein
MINLLPHNEKKNIRREYRLRLMALAVLLLGVLAYLTAILFIPSFILSIYRKSLSANEVERVNNATTDNKDLMLELAQRNNLVNTLRPDAEKITPTIAVAMISKYLTPMVSLSDISYSSADGKQFQMSVRGVSADREGLLLFTNGLKKEPGITKVDVPVSNFVKDANIQFTFTIEGTLK